METAFELLRTNLSMELESKCKTIAITSSIQKEGKSFVASELAKDLAKQNAKVLLINFSKNKESEKNPDKGISSIFYKFFEEPFLNIKVDNYGIHDLLYLVFLKNRTGRLSLVNERGQNYILDFENGKLCYITSQDHEFKDFFISKLSKQSHLSVIKLEEIIAASKRIRKPIFELLKDQKVISPEHLQKTYNDSLSEFLKGMLEKKILHFKWIDELKISYVNITKFFLSLPELVPFTFQHEKYLTRIFNEALTLNSQGYREIPLGKAIIKKSALFQTNRLEKFVILLRLMNFDWVIFDLPSLDEEKEAVKLCKIVDYTLLVIKSGILKRKKIESSIATLKENQVPKIGSILNESKITKKVIKFQ